MSSENALTAEVQAEGLQFRPAAEGITVLDGKDYQVALPFIQAIQGEHRSSWQAIQIDFNITYSFKVTYLAVCISHI